MLPKWPAPKAAALQVAAWRKKLSSGDDAAQLRALVEMRKESLAGRGQFAEILPLVAELLESTKAATSALALRCLDLFNALAVNRAHVILVHPSSVWYALPASTFCEVAATLSQRRLFVGMLRGS